MAGKFTIGMKNFLEVLNQMWDAFVVGPFNALPLIGGTLTGPLVAPSVAAVRVPALSTNIGSNAGWWKVARLNVNVPGAAATLRIAGTTAFAGSAATNASNGMLTTVLLRVDNDGVVRGSFYSVGASTNSTVQHVRVGDDGVVYVNVAAFFTLDVYLDAGSWLPQPLAYVGYDIPANTHVVDPIYGLKLGTFNALTLTPTLMTAGMNFDTRHLTPSTDNAYDVGSSSRAYRTVYARTGTINTSDARLKCDWADLTAAEIAAACDLARASRSYRWIDAVAEKGAEARRHIGPTVQAAIEIMTAHGLDPFRYGFICHDTWEREVIEHAATPGSPAVPASDEVPAVHDDDGAVLTPAVPASPGYPAVAALEAYTEVVREAGDRYAFRYSELSMFMAAGQAAHQDALEQRIAALEATP